MTVRELRKTLRQQRRALTPSQQRLAAQSLVEHVSRQSWFCNSRRMAFFIASDGEINPGPLLALAQAAGKTCFLPVLHPLKLNRLHFARYTADTPLSPNRFGIPESDDAEERVLDLIERQDAGVRLALTGAEHLL